LQLILCVKLYHCHYHAGSVYLLLYIGLITTLWTTLGYIYPLHFAKLRAADPVVTVGLSALAREQRVVLVAGLLMLFIIEPCHMLAGDV